MLYYLGLSRMNREESVALTAQLKILTGLNLVGDSVRKTTAKVKTGLISGLAKLLDRQGRTLWAEQIRGIDNNVSWETEALVRNMKLEMERLSQLSDSQLMEELRKELRSLAEVNAEVDDGAVAAAILERAARSLGIDPNCYIDPAVLELVVFEKAVQRQYEELKKRLQGMSALDMEKLAAAMEQELQRLSQGEREAIQQFTGAERLSGQAMVGFMKTASGVVLAKMIFAGTGFGAYLFLTTALKATSLLLGISFSYGAYTAATSVLALLVSGPALAMIAGLSAGVVLHKMNKKLADRLAQVVVVNGYWRMSNARCEKEAI